MIFRLYGYYRVEGLLTYDTVPEDECFFRVLRDIRPDMQIQQQWLLLRGLVLEQRSEGRCGRFSK